jgi:hypothetical protein
VRLPQADFVRRKRQFSSEKWFSAAINRNGIRGNNIPVGAKPVKPRTGLFPWPSGSCRRIPGYSLLSPHSVPGKNVHCHQEYSLFFVSDTLKHALSSAIRLFWLDRKNIRN